MMLETIQIIEKGLTDSLIIDSLSNKITNMQCILDKQSPITNYSIWIPLISAMAGGALVLVGQSIDRRFKTKTEITNSLREIYAYSRKLEALMKNNYRELAMAKVHVEYWWYCNATSTGEDKGRYYEEHLRSQSLAREVERKIGENKADFIGHIRKFQAIKALKSEIETQLLAISNLENAKAKKYDFALNHEDVREKKVEEDEQELRQKYYLNLEHFNSINNYLQTLI